MDPWNLRNAIAAWARRRGIPAPTAAMTQGGQSDGTVVATGLHDNGQCDVSGWTDVVAVGVAGRYTVGLRADGTVVATGENAYAVSKWTDIRIPDTNP